MTKYLIKEMTNKIFPSIWRVSYNDFKEIITYIFKISFHVGLREPYGKKLSFKSLQNRDEKILFI